MIATNDWETTAGGAKISKSGEIVIGDLVAQPTSIYVTESPLATEIDLSILDLAPTIAKVLGLPDLPEATGQSQSDLEAEHGVMIVVDGLQYQRLLSMIAQGSLPFFERLPVIERGLTVFPPITTASTAALLTGAPPHINGVYGYGMRSTEIATLFDHAAEQGLSVTAVEGQGLAFNLRNAEVILSGDRDGDRFTDDNVLANSLDVINSAMPDLLFIHFHDVDDQGHSYGPDSPQYEEAIIRVDSYLSQILDALPSNTFITIFADHGMQADLASNGGNHGQLTESAMVIPIIFIKK
jgi:predicted AlkP superfamily pyrophosphatase or phosphodiesterase